MVIVSITVPSARTSNTQRATDFKFQYSRELNSKGRSKGDRFTIGQMRRGGVGINRFFLNLEEHLTVLILRGGAQAIRTGT